MKALLLSGLALAVAAQAQVSIRFTPEPIVVAASVIASANDLGRWEIAICDDGPTLVTLQWERVAMAAGDIRFIDPADALLVLAGHQRKTVAARIARYGGVVLQLTALGLAVASKSNYSWATGLSLTASLGAPVVSLAGGQVPAITPLESGIRYPVTMEPGACYTDHRFAAKMRNARVHTATIGPVPSAPVSHPIQKSAVEAIMRGCVKIYEDGVLTEDTCNQSLSAKLDVRYLTQ